MFFASGTLFIEIKLNGFDKKVAAAYVIWKNYLPAKLILNQVNQIHTI